MKKLILALVFFGALAYLYWFLTTPRSSPVYVSPTDQISKQEKPVPAHEVYGIIEEINANAEKVQSIYVRDMPIRLQQGNMSAKVYGELAMQKPNQFRLKVAHSITGKEMDIGSNNEYFWFWSRRFNPPALHYALHGDLHKTMLRSALNPNWMMESMNVGKISTENISVAKFKEFWAVIQPRKGLSDEEVTVMTLIDPRHKVVVGRYLYNSAGRMIASTEYQGFSGQVPKKMLIIWYEENIILEWDLSAAQINVGISPEFWVMPNMRNRIDMGKQ